ncbi:MAG: WD40 repeat domain-containing protein [bacterium]|nr:WD40 repeat domain-containing protein [bacterium]
MPKQIAKYDYHSLANLSADGKRALAIGKGKFKPNPTILVDYATIFDTETGAILAQYTDYQNPKAMSLSPDGARAILFYQVNAGGAPQDPIFEYPLLIWNMQNNTVLECGRQLQPSDMTWLDNDRFVVMRLNGYSSVELTVYDASGTQLSQFEYKWVGYWHYLAVNDDIVAMGIQVDLQNLISLINPTTGAELKRFSLGVRDRIAQTHRSLFYAPNGNFIATLQQTNNKAILVWDVHTDAPPIELKANNYITALAWSPDSTQLLSAEKESDVLSNIYIWDIATGEKKLFTEINYEPTTYAPRSFIKSLHWHGNKIYITPLYHSIMVWQV